MKITLKVCSLLVAIFIASLPITFAVELRLTYDANGNLVAGDGKYRTYNSLNQLAAVYNGTNTTGTLLETYVYHPTEERILKKTAYNANGSVKETTYYISQTFVRVVNASGSFDYVYVYQNGQLVAQNLNGTKEYMADDLKGDVVAVMNASGAAIENTTYGPFGAITSGGTQSKKGYENKEYDSVVGDTDFNARKYNSAWGLFLQPDTTIQNAYDPQMLNHYSFERDNPYRYADPTGHKQHRADDPTNWAGPVQGLFDVVNGVAGEIKCRLNHQPDQADQAFNLGFNNAKADVYGASAPTGQSDPAHPDAGGLLWSVMTGSIPSGQASAAEIAQLKRMCNSPASISEPRPALDSSLLDLLNGKTTVVGPSGDDLLAQQNQLGTANFDNAMNFYYDMRVSYYQGQPSILPALQYQPVKASTDAGTSTTSTEVSDVGSSGSNDWNTWFDDFFNGGGGTASGDDWC